MADIDSMIGPPTKIWGKAARWYFKICMWVIAPVLLVGVEQTRSSNLMLFQLVIFILAMVGGFEVSYKAWNEETASYTVPSPAYPDWVQGIIISLQVI